MRLPDRFKVHVSRLLIPLIAAIIVGCVKTGDIEKPSTPAAGSLADTVLSLNLDLAEATWDKSIQSYAIGGKMPYTFSLLSGSGTVDAATGLYVPATNFVGSAQIQVTDALGQLATASVQIYDHLQLTPVTTVTYVGRTITLNVTGGKGPYYITQQLGDAVVVSSTPTSITLTMPSHQDTITMMVTDSLFNIATASIIVVPPLLATIDSALFPTTRSDGSMSYASITISGGKPDPATGEFSLTTVQGSGTLNRIDATHYTFTPTSAYIDQTGNNDVIVRVTDSLAQSRDVQFGFFVPLVVTSGATHNCALYNNNLVGQIKCWGDGIHGQLGYGDDAYSQPYWGDCTNCNEDSRASTTNTENFKRVDLLSSTERSNGGYIVNFDYGSDTLCAVVAKDSSGTQRTLRCLGANTPLVLGSSQITVNSNRFPFVGKRHNYISSSVTTPSSIYRVASSDVEITSGGSIIALFFPRFFNVLANSGSYQIQGPNMRQHAGAVASQYLRYDPSQFTFYDSLSASGWQPDNIFLSKNVLTTQGGYASYAYTSTTYNMKEGDVTYKGYSLTSTPVADKPLLPGSTGISKVVSRDSSIVNDCYIGTNGYAYCLGSNTESSVNGILGINSSSGVPNQILGNTGAGLPLPVTTTIGGDADRVFDISASQKTVCGIFDGTAAAGSPIYSVNCWGQNGTFGLLGNNLSPSSQIYAAPVLKASGGNLVGASKVIITNVFGCALIPGGTVGQQLYCWGNANNYHMTSQYTGIQSRAVPISFGTDTVLDFYISDLGYSAADMGGVGCAITLNAGVKYLKCWGESSMVSYPIPKPKPGYYALDIQTYVTGAIDPVQVKFGFSGGCMLPSSRQYLKCWGDNRAGTLGMGNGIRGNKPGDMASLPVVNVGSSRKVKQLSAGFEHTCAILDNDLAKCWGSNLYGELGLGLAAGFGDSGVGHNHRGLNANEMGDYLPNLSFPGDPNNKVRLIASGGDHACAVTFSNNMYCWGDNSVGQLGLNSATTIFTSPQKVTLPTGTITQIALGIEHTCALLDTGSQRNLYCWGSNESGQLGYGNLTDAMGLAAHTDNRIGNSPTDIAVASLPPVYFGGVDVKQIAAGGLNTCIVFINGRARCFGKNNYGQIGIGTFDNNFDGINDDMGLRLSDIGYNYLLNFGSNPQTKTPHKVQKIVVGLDFSCAILDGNYLKCWGYNAYGQLGVQDTQNRGVNNGEMGDSLPYVILEPGQTVLSVSLGALHSCATLSNNQIKCWGANYAGQLGFDADFGRGAYPFTMGLSLPNARVGF